MRLDQDTHRRDPDAVEPDRAHRADRRLLDDGMAEWHIYERVCGASDYSTVRLVFESAGAVRTLSRFPDNWSELPDDELLALSHRPPRG